MKKSILIFSLLWAITFHTYAQEWPGMECDKYISSYDQTYCYAKLFVESDKELNSIYKELHRLLTGKIKQQLIEVQRAWIKYRDQTCSSNNGTIDVNCNYDLNRSRIIYLQNRLRECKAGIYRPDMISRKSWE